MKQFNLEEYLKNPERKVVTRDGRKVTRFLCTDAKNNYPIVAMIETFDGSIEQLRNYTKNGYFCADESDNELDLFFAPEKHEGWMNIYKHNDGHYEGDGNIYSTEEECKANQTSCYRYQYLTTIKIEWEE